MARKYLYFNSSSVVLWPVTLSDDEATASSEGFSQHPKNHAVPQVGVSHFPVGADALRFVQLTRIVFLAPRRRGMLQSSKIGGSRNVSQTSCKDVAAMQAKEQRETHKQRCCLTTHTCECSIVAPFSYAKSCIQLIPAVAE